MRIGLDVMGGDFAPDAAIDGALLAHKELSAGDRIILIGSDPLIRKMLLDRGIAPGMFDVVHAPDTIGMGEHPTKALIRKPESSIGIGFHLLKHKKIDAFASAGNSGAMLVGSIFSALLNRLKFIKTKRFRNYQSTCQTNQLLSGLEAVFLVVAVMKTSNDFQIYKAQVATKQT